MTSMILWSSGFPASEELFKTWHPLMTAIGRLIIGGLALLPLMMMPSNRLNFALVPWKKVFYIGGVGLGFSTVCLNVGIMYSNAVTAAILVTMMPPAAFMLAMIDGERRLTLRWALGISMAVAGGIWASLYNEAGTMGFQGGELMIGLAVLSFAWYSRGTVKHFEGMSIVSITTLTLLAGGVVTTAVIVPAQMTGMVDLYFDLSPRPVGLLVWISAIANGFAMLCWLNAVSRIGVTVGAFHQNMVPFYVMLIAVAWGGSIVGQQFLAALVVISGVVVTQWRNAD